MYRFLRWYNEQKWPMKLLFILATLIFLAVVFIGDAFCVGSFIKAIESIQGEQNTIWYFALQSPKGIPVTAISYAILIVIIIVSFQVTLKNRVKESDERGVHYMEDNTYGSARWMNEDEIRDAFEVSPIEDTRTTIYGQLTEGGQDVVGWKQNRKASGSRNTLLIASTGSGKSFTFVRTELIQAVLRGNSFVVTDPSAELYTDLSLFCKERGVDVHVLNLANPDYSEFWNCVEEIIDPKTERLDSSSLNEFVDIYMQNTGKGKDDFWYGSALNLIRAVVGYTAWEYENDILSAYISLYKKIKGMPEGGEDMFTEKLKTEIVPFPQIRDVIRKAAKSKDFDLDALEKLFIDIKKYAPAKPLSMGQVFANLINFDSLCEKMEIMVMKWHPAKIAYDMFTSNDTDLVRKSALQGAQLRFQIFADYKLKEILSHDGIHLKDVNLKQSAYFVITSDKSTATTPIASLFFSFLFKDAQNTYDEHEQIAKETGKPNPCIPLVTMLDEFYSLGIIGGSPESFATTMSNSRKRKIYISIIIQSYPQLQDRYGPDIKDIIQSNCSTLLYLGGFDPATCRFISDFGTGDATVLTESHDQLIGPLNKGIPTDYKIRSDQRSLLTMDEARKWKDKVLVVVQGENPAKLEPFPWTEHPMYKNGLISPRSIYSSVGVLQDRLDKMRLYRIDNNPIDPKSYIHEQILDISKKKEEIVPTQIELDFSADLFEEDIFYESEKPTKKSKKAASPLLNRKEQ